MSAKHAPEPTLAQLAVLRNLVAGRPAGFHLRGRSALGALTRTIGAMSRRGWVDGSVYAPTISNAGRSVLIKAGQS